MGLQHVIDGLQTLSFGWINDILDLADMTVREIMKPRVDMIMAEDTEPARAALDRMRGTGYSRLPVYHDTIDNIIEWRKKE